VAQITRHSAVRVGNNANSATITAAQAIRHVLWDVASSDPSFVQALPAFSQWLGLLLDRTFDFFTTPITRYFEHLVLGSDGVASTFGVQPDFPTQAYLSAFDRPLLSTSTCARLKDAAGRQRIGIATYTARPSRPPVGIDNPPLGYAPEAEMARALAGLQEFPLIAAGRMLWLAEELRVPVDQIVKPSPVQALAAIAAAWSGAEMAALRAAAALGLQGLGTPPIIDMEPISVHVFEDTLGGLDGIDGAVSLLQGAGKLVEWLPYGIAPHAGVKAEALNAHGIPLYPSINEAVASALQLADAG